MSFMTRAGPRRRRWPGRLARSAALGAVLAVFVVVFEATARHAQMVAGAAQSRETLAGFLIAGGIGLWLALTVVVFILSSAAAALRRSW
jgi:hypothetical protein